MYDAVLWIGSHGRFLDLGPRLPGLRASTSICKWASQSVQNTFNVKQGFYHIDDCESFAQRTSGKVLKIKAGKVYKDPLEGGMYTSKLSPAIEINQSHKSALSFQCLYPSSTHASYNTMPLDIVQVIGVY